jgi:uncharacterized surface protein with fasciclin (FAS1) repeats
MRALLRFFALAAVLAAATPAAAKPILETAADTGTFTVLLAAIKQAGLTEMLSGPGPYTLFAPSDDAFGKLPKDTYLSLFRPENQQKLKTILLHHLIAGTVYAHDVNGKRLEAEVMAGNPLLIDATRSITVDGAKVVQADMRADNGVIHVIDTVLLPK